MKKNKRPGKPAQHMSREVRVGKSAAKKFKTKKKMLRKYKTRKR